MGTVKRKYVVPGDLIEEGNYRVLTNAIKVGNKIYSTKIGLAEIMEGKIKVIPLRGPYVPKVDDMVIGIIVDYAPLAWAVDINSYFEAFLPAQNVFGKGFNHEVHDLTQKFKLGDLIAAKIVSFERGRDPMLTVSGPGLGKITRGELVRISPVKVPRLIGRKGSMSKIIEQATKCSLLIGQNGLVIVSGPPEGVVKAIKAIKLVEAEAHLSGLTQNIQNILRSEG
jgi:exosome complex component RRP4